MARAFPTRLYQEKPSHSLSHAPNPLKLPRILPTHPNPIPRPLPPLPKPMTLLPHQPRMTKPTILRSIIPFSRTKSTNHSIGVFIRMLFGFIVASITCEDFLTTAESEPSVGFLIMFAYSPRGKFLSCYQTQSFLFTARTAAWLVVCTGNPKKFHFRNFEDEFLVAVWSRHTLVVVSPRTDTIPRDHGVEH